MSKKIKQVTQNVQERQSQLTEDSKMADILDFSS